MKYATLLLLLISLSACDRFADEHRLLVVDVVDASGEPVRGVRIHASPRLSPQTPVSEEFRYFATTGRIDEEVFFSVVREASGAQTEPQSAGTASPDSPRAINVESVQVGAGLFRLRVRQGQEVREVAFALAVDRSGARFAPTQFVTGPNGIAELDLDAYGIGRRVDLTLSTKTDVSSETRSVTLSDTLDLVFFAPSDSTTWTMVAPLRSGLTRLTSTKPAR